MPIGSPQWMYASGEDAFTIDQSLRFDGSSSRLDFTAGTPTNALIYTWSFWAKRGNIGSYQQMFAAGPVRGGGDVIRFSSNDGLYVSFDDGNSGQLETTAKFRDPSAWYHIVVAVDTSQSTDTNRVKIYVNGVQHTSFGIETFPAEDYDTPAFNTSGKTFNIGRGHPDEQYFDGYLAEFYFIDGQQLTPSSFGETGDYGEWKPIEVEGLTYGNNGFYLPFSVEASVEEDRSGNDNDFNSVNIAISDVVLDSPTNNFATWNPIQKDEALPAAVRGFAQGNLQCTTTGNPYGAANGRIFGTIGVTSGKWYYEWVMTTDSSSVGSAIGWADNDHSDEVAYYVDGTIRGSGSSESYGATWTTGDIIGVAFNADTNAITYYKNGASQGEITISDNHTFGTNQAYFPFVWDGSGNPTITGVANFGQDSSFAGNKTAQGNQDSGGIGDFYYTPPSGFKALCTSNLPAVAVVPSEHFNTILWTGDDTDDRSITGVGFQPDWTWNKRRNHTASHMSYDAIRGATKNLLVNTTNAENTEANAVQAFESDGFQVGDDANSNSSSYNFVAWNWKAGNATLGTGDFTQGGIASTCSRNVDAGFSIVSYTGTGTTGTVGHGLSSTPEMYIVKNRDTVENWAVYVEALGNAKRLGLDGTGAATVTNNWNSTSPTANVFTVYGGETRVNDSGDDYIAYCFHSVDGYSKVGSFSGNSNADGTFVYCGFKPALVIQKGSDHAHGWQIWDNKRDPHNVATKELFANGTNAEYTDATYTSIDFVSNGFKLRTSNSSENSGENIFLAFAETPFKYSNAR